MTLRSLDGLQTILRAAEGAAGGGSSGELSLSQGLALYQPPEEENNDATAGDGNGAEQESEPAEAGNDAGPDEVPGETEDESDPADNEPPIAPPRSWTKEDKAAFEALPRATQERIAENERARESEVNRRLQEAAGKSKGVEAREQAAEQARQRYESGVAQLAQATQAHLAGNFADITSWDDVQKLAVEDPIRYNEFRVARDRAEAAAAEQQRISQTRYQEQTRNFEAYRSEEMRKFIEAAPEFADPQKAPAAQAGVRDMLVNDFGVSPEEMKALWVDGQPMSFHDHRVQLLIRDAYLYRQAKKALAKKPAVTKPVQSVQRPGPAVPRGEAANSRIKQIDQTLSRTGGRDAGLALIRERLGKR